MSKKMEGYTIVYCPECKTTLKQQNFINHMKYVHNKKIDNAKVKRFGNSNKNKQENKTQRVISKMIIGIIIIISIVAVTTTYLYFLSNPKPKELNDQNYKKIYFVSIDGTGNFSSIQKAIDIASNHDTIFVNNGTYFENIQITKSIELIGWDKNTTIINGNDSGTVINISADHVKIKGFTIKNSGSQSQNNDAGIKIGSDYNTISDLNISFNKNYGLYLYENPKNTNNTIKFNTFSNNKYGVYTEGAKTNNISSNTFTNNTDYGMYLLDLSNDNMISDNLFAENNYALRIKGSTMNTVINNMIINNTYGLYFCCNSEDNFAYNNVFINNTVWNAKDGVRNKWDNGIVGNYWDDYNGIDANGDGIGDTPYIINSDKDDKDSFPLMQPI